MIDDATPQRLRVRVPLISNPEVRRAFAYCGVFGVVMVLALIGWYRNHSLAEWSEGLPFIMLLIGAGLIVMGCLTQWRLEVQVSDVLRCRRGIGPFSYGNSIPVQSIGCIALIPIRHEDIEDEVSRENLVLGKHRVRRPALEYLTCAVIDRQKQVALKMGMRFEVSAQLAALLRHHLRTSGQNQGTGLL